MKTRLMFVSYSDVSPTGGAKWGAFKRCLRLISALPPDRVQVHLAHLGSLPSDPSSRTALRSVTVHHLQGDLYRSLGDAVAAARPQALVIGDTPMAGLPRTAYRTAHLLNLPHVVCADYRNHFTLGETLAYWPRAHGWLFIGLPERGGYGLKTDRSWLAPPLVGARATAADRPERLTIIGGDESVARCGLRILERLPRWTEAVLVNVKSPLPDSFRHDPRITVIEKPTDGEYRDLLERSRVVVAKSGFNQIVESLALGAPIIGVYTGHGGISGLSRYLCGHAEVVGPAQLEANLDALAARAVAWMDRSPAMPWASAVQEVADPASFAVEGIRRLLGCGTDWTLKGRRASPRTTRAGSRR